MWIEGDLERKHFTQHSRSLLQRDFGPNGVSPPTCGGPGSGYVCCKVDATNSGKTVFVPNPGFQTLPGLQTAPSNVNTVGGAGNSFSGNSFNNGFQGKQEQRPFRGSGQCGVRNAQGINGRVAAGTFAPNDGDTEFGKKAEVLFFSFILR